RVFYLDVIRTDDGVDFRSDRFCFRFWHQLRCQSYSLLACCKEVPKSLEAYSRNFSSSAAMFANLPEKSRGRTVSTGWCRASASSKLKKLGLSVAARNRTSRSDSS